MNVAGIILAVLGVIFLFNNAGVFPTGVWSIVWPAALVVVGLWLISSSRREERMMKGGYDYYYDERYGDEMMRGEARMAGGQAHSDMSKERDEKNREPK